MAFAQLPAVPIPVRLLAGGYPWQASQEPLAIISVAPFICNALFTKIVAYVVPVVLMLSWQLQVVPSGNPPGVATEGCPALVGGGNPWHVLQPAIDIVAGRNGTFQVGALLVPLVSPPGILAP